MTELKLVILDCPYDTISEARTQRLLIETAAMKIAGYRINYAYGVLPVDTSDFVCRHFLICTTTDTGLRVLSASKSISLSRCKTFNLPFPALSLAKANQPEHLGYVERNLAEAAREGVEVIYQSSWSADPEIRSRDRALATTLKELILTQIIWEALETAPARIMAAGVPRVKTDDMFKNLGYHPAAFEGRILPPFKVPSSLNEEAVFLDLKETTLYARKLMKKYQHLWDARLIISAAGKQSPAKAA